MKVNFPLISIIVPNYNHDKYLNQRLESIFNQSYINFEVILLDDCSTDNSRNILLEYAKNPKVSYCVFNDLNSGNTFEQWNKGIQLAKGEFIWIAESDDFSDSSFLEIVSEPLISNEDVVLSFCQSNRVDENGEITGTWKTHTDYLDLNQFSSNFIMQGDLFIKKYLIYKNVIPNASGVLIRKSICKEIGTLEVDSYLKYCGDWLLYFELLMNNKVAFSNQTLNNFRYHSQSVIAKATAKGILDRNNIIEIQLRKKMHAVLSKSKKIKLIEIRKLNKNLLNKLQYEQVYILNNNNQKIKACLLFFSIFQFFLKNFYRQNYILFKAYFK
jgi:glycosyltransferase involved in cell wall biosynthesis